MSEATASRKAQIRWNVSAEQDRDAVDLYRESLADLYEVTDLAGARGDFVNRARSFRFDHFVLGQGVSVGQTMRRGPDEIRRSGLDALSIIMNRAPLVGDCDGRDVASRAGTIHFRDLTRPGASRLKRVELVNLMIPRAAAPDWLLQPGLHGFSLDGRQSRTRLIAAHLTALVDLAPELSADEGAAGIEAALLMMGRTVGLDLAMRPDQAAAAYRSVRRMAIEAMDRRLMDSALTVESLAREIGVSRSTLYRAFDPVGGVRTQIQNRRLERARRALSQRRGRTPSINTIAHDHGFASDAHFSRAFRARFGIAPGDVGPPARDQTGTVEVFDAARHDIMLDWIRAA